MRWLFNRRARSSFFRWKKFGQCGVCRIPTKLIELNYGCFMHRWPCCRIMDRRYWRAVGEGQK